MSTDKLITQIYQIHGSRLGERPPSEFSAHFWPRAWVFGSSDSLTWAGLLRKPSTRQGTAEEELFAWVVSGPSLGCWCSSLVIAHYGSQIASNSAGIDQH